MYLTCIWFLIDIICPALPWSSSRPPANHLLTIDTLHQSSSIHTIDFPFPCSLLHSHYFHDYFLLQTLSNIYIPHSIYV